MTQNPSHLIDGFLSEELLRMYDQMCLVRRFEERVDDLFAEGVLTGTCHLGIGQEAVAVGTVHGLDPGDYVSSTHRGHGHFLAKGADPARVMAEMFGKASGYSGGRGGSQHMADLSIGFLGSNGITGGGVPIGTGAALALSRRKSKQVVAVFLGDGAANQGVFHESVNMAALWKLPVVYVCENNGYAMSTSTRRSTAAPSLRERTQSFGLPGLDVEGNDVTAVARAVRDAAARARSGQGPTFIEARTYRMCGHSKSDRCEYRTRQEESDWETRCPIRRLADLLLKNGLARALDLDAADRRAKDRVAAAEQFARNAPQPVPGTGNQGAFA